MENLRDILGQIGKGNMNLDFLMDDVLQRRRIIEEIGGVTAELGDKIIQHKNEIEDLAGKVAKFSKPEVKRIFSEVGHYDGYTSLKFFHDTASFTSNYMTGPLRKIAKLSKRIHESGVQEKRRQKPAQLQAYDLGFNEEEAFKLIQLDKTLNEIDQLCLDTIGEGVLSLENFLKLAYQRVIDQFRYFQKRFMNIGKNSGSAYRNPWDNKAPSGFNLDRVHYAKVELIEDSVFLTELVLDIIDHLPREYIKKVAKKGKKKFKEKRHLDDFAVERAARIWIELSDKKYQSFAAAPNEFMDYFSNMVKDYHALLSELELPLRKVIDEHLKDPSKVITLGDETRFEEPIIDPYSMLGRIKCIDFTSIMQNSEDLKPENEKERRFMKAQKELMNHVFSTLKNIGDTSSDQEEEIAKLGVKKAVELARKMNETMQVHSRIKIQRDKASGNEFYVGTSGDHGSFRFEREASPNVRLKDVVGASFDTLKQHLNDLADYQKYLHLYKATSPRGKIKSNLIAIGPYGCGKTEIGRAIAGDPRFIGCEVAVTDLLTCWFGEFEKNVDRVWDAARQLRRQSGDNKLVFLLMDEFDSWFNSSSGHWVSNTHSRAQKAVQQKLDGVVDYEGIVTVGFTNEPAKIPLAIYRRFKYVEIVGELEKSEQIYLMKKFIKRGMPMSTGFREKHWSSWADQLAGATGDVIGKVIDDLHYELMGQLMKEFPTEGKKLDRYCKRMYRKGDKLDMKHVKRSIGKHIKVTPDWLNQKLEAKLAEPIIREQINTAVRVYAEAKDVMNRLHKRQDAASGSYSQRPDMEIEPRIV